MKIREGMVQVCFAVGPQGPFKRAKETESGKKAASDAPSWVKQHLEGKPYIHENGKDFANRMMRDKYGVRSFE